MQPQFRSAGCIRVGKTKTGGRAAACLEMIAADDPPPAVAGLSAAPFSAGIDPAASLLKAALEKRPHGIIMGGLDRKCGQFVVGRGPGRRRDVAADSGNQFAMTDEAVGLHRWLCG